MTFLSIITPTYNRAQELAVCYNSLTSQNNKNFEWIIVDDGSTDDTETLVKSWIESNTICIRYIKQENLGRYMALNKGVEEATGYLSMYMDSDDWFVDNAIDEIQQYWDALDSNLKENLCGLSALCYNEQGDVIGDAFPQDGYISDFFDLRINMNIKGDKKELIKTSILKQYSFPYFPGQKRMPTSYVLYGIAKHYQAIFINKGIIYKQYIQTGWTKNIDNVRMNNAITSREYYKHIVNLHYPFKLKKAIGFYTNYFRYVLHSGYPFAEAFQNLKWSMVTPLGCILGSLFYTKDKFKNRNRF
jgi:glycosyltransferase involved in cell wall biosynthesis